jgi:hypothetical protein
MTQPCFQKLPVWATLLIAGGVLALGCESSQHGLHFGVNTGVSEEGGQGEGTPVASGGVVAYTTLPGKGGSTASPGTSGSKATTMPGSGGSKATTTVGYGGNATAGGGGATPPKGSGGSVATGGSPATLTGVSGGRSSVGGSPATGGSSLVPPPAAAPPTVSDSGYVSLSAGTVVMVGYIVSSTAGSGSSITLTYGKTDFCASGTVAPNSTYKSWANAGFTVNQAQSGASGSSNSLVLSGSTISVSYSDKGGSQLQFQLYDGSNYWCYMLPPSTGPTTVTLPFSKLNTQCWDGAGRPFVSGTAITSVSIVVPGSGSTATPYSFCFLGLTVN